MEVPNSNKQPVGVVQHSNGILAKIFTYVATFIGGAILGMALYVLLGIELTLIPQMQPTTINQDLEKDLRYEAIEEIYDKVRNQYDGELSSTDIVEGLKQGLVNSIGDPYSEYIPVDQVGNWWDRFHGQLVGIGIYFELNSSNQPTVIRTIDNTPAQRGGLLARDIILEVDDYPTTGLSLTAVADRILGEEGTDVKLLIRRSGVDDFEVVLTRAEIVDISVAYEIRDDIAILTINKFIAHDDEAIDTLSLVKVAVDDFKQASLSKLIVDLRNNPGGDVDTTVKIASLWLNPDDVVTKFVREGQTAFTYTTKDLGDYSQALRPFETVILINDFSASASEMLAGALSEYQLATLVGSASFGKGSVQNLFNNFYHQPQGLLKLTTMHWTTPSGEQFGEDNKLVPNIEIADDLSTLDIDEPLLRAIELLES